MYKPRLLHPLTQADSQLWAAQTHLAHSAWHAESVQTEGGRVGAYSTVRAVSKETVEGTLPLKRLDPRFLCVPQRRKIVVGAGAARRQGRWEYKFSSLVNAVMPAGKVPFKPFRPNRLQGDEGA